MGIRISLQHLLEHRSLPPVSRPERVYKSLKAMPYLVSANDRPLFDSAAVFCTSSPAAHLAVEIALPDPTVPVLPSPGVAAATLGTRLSMTTSIYWSQGM